MSARERIASQIRATMAARGWSAARLAREAGVAPSTITRALDDGGRFVMSNRTLEALGPILLFGTPSDSSMGSSVQTCSSPPRPSGSEGNGATNLEQRRRGYYWVRTSWGDVEIAEWSFGRWWLVGDRANYDGCITPISDRLEPPDA